MPSIKIMTKARLCIHELDALHRNSGPRRKNAVTGRYCFCRSLVFQAIASLPSQTPAGLAFFDSGDALTITSCLARSASCGNLRSYAVRLMNRRNWCCLCRDCNCHDESNSDYPDHVFLPRTARNDDASDMSRHRDATPLLNSR
jgi:hypothetical protein